jgi:hypothetical protein
MWMTALQFIIKRPWIIALVVMTLVLGTQWVRITDLKGDVVNLKNDIVEIRTDFKTCKSNEVTLNDVIGQCQAETGEFKDNILLLDTHLRAEKDRVVMWRDKYNNKVCYNAADEVVVIKPDEVRVLNYEKNADAINRINDIFGD